jgi:hypothetical protein
LRSVRASGIEGSASACQVWRLDHRNWPAQPRVFK